MDNGPDETVMMSSNDEEELRRSASEIFPNWAVLEKNYVLRSEITFFSQLIMVYVMIIVCVNNLSISNGDSNLWTVVQYSAIYCLHYPCQMIKNVL